MNLIKKYSYRTGLLLVFLIGAFLRFYKLGSLPFEPHEDEILVGYVGRYILENGKDIYGNPWPLLYFNKFGDYYIIGSMYLSGLATYIFGINEFAVRFPAAFLGSLIIFPVAILGYWITNNKLVGILSAFSIAIMPWHIILSRSSAEGIIGSTIFITAIVLLLFYIKKGKIRDLAFAAFLILMSYWIYHPFRIYAPLVFIPLFFLFKNLSRKQVLALTITSILFFALTLYISTTEWGGGRLKQTSIFSDLSGVNIKIQQQIYNSGNSNTQITRLFHNKAIGYGHEFITQYLSYFSPLFLFIKTGVESRYDVPDQGLLYFTFLIAIITLLLAVGQKIKYEKKYLYYFVYLILLAPLPAAFTYFGSPNLHRTVFFAVILSIFIGIGLFKLVTMRINKFITPVLTILIIVEIIYFWHQYSVQSDIYLGSRRNDGQREIVQYIIENHNKVDAVHVPGYGNLALYYLFFSKDFDKKYISDFYNDALIDKIGNVKFEKEVCLTELESMDTKVNSLIINKPKCNIPKNFVQVTEISGRDPVFKSVVYRTGKL
ncbi:hypothetical protein A3A93_00700 [Candidatus Roizmanbacteria bacterium RIFCSPLOWO2_01_FULL_38_12]|uniref:Glycosyltransferase RgtA/B/C/D-like domain-containing protein n=1 Tax=Candidatus Roizmanbacteria bacterium RIFCSPLOWO2_01_FULL_38_12 TaxID=1802061 RepID=A0A1F7J087_9BACT|nr:MAG: hypothetical protein A2861_00135 [Candidatus Roizmanbacteria bacterium RIFCSPHIGHO2_01_FULL_38_15]OGK49014.1 MAG: hypothetical protein A3A93_00700 [Candidatus Roizmanbacteria bacterium RIFCSPLOWO2_01_FULL_38_12]